MAHAVALFPSSDRMTSQWQAPNRNAVLATDDMVAANHPGVAKAGAQVLSTGGNAIDATIAMAAMSWLALPGQCGVGGDAFAVVRSPNGSVVTVGGSGFGPDGGSPGFYRDRGFSALPLSGPLAVAAPGAIAALVQLHTQGATRALDELWAPAIAAAEHGLPCTQKTRENILDFETELRNDDGMRQVFLRAGRAPQIGERLPQRELAASLRLLARLPESMYDGELAQRAVAWLVEGDAPFSGAEWALAADALVGPAIVGSYGGMLVHETPLPTPGWMVLQQAALCDAEVGQRAWLGASAIGWFAAAARRSFRDRWDHCGSDTDAWVALLGEQAISAARDEIRQGRHSLAATGLHPDGDTTSTVAVDADGMAVSFIQSLAFTFGARTMVPGTGIVLNNRLARGAYLVDGHPNEVRPRRRPLHTLNAWIVTDDSGQLRHVGNTPGGDGQVQWNMQILSHLIDHDLDPQEAVSAPRFTVYPGSDADAIGASEELRCEARLSEETVAELRTVGHDVRLVGPWDAGGGALVISADHRLGCLSGGADPRQDGVALGD